jgi:cyclopropane fatty-acyl-phospholipid synthase-like methyltransferase
MYRQSRDPWNFSRSEYERGRYRATLDGLLRRSYRRAFEPGCSIGEFTAQLAGRCDQVVATDVAPSAVALACERCRRLKNVYAYQADLANGPAKGPFDLIVMSEVGYYFQSRTLAAIAIATSAQLEAGGEFVAVHWLGHSADHVLGGDEVHELLANHLPLEWIKGQRHPGYRIDTWKRP